MNRDQEPEALIVRVGCDNEFTHLLVGDHHVPGALGLLELLEADLPSADIANVSVALGRTIEYRSQDADGAVSGCLGELQAIAPLFELAIVEIGHLDVGKAIGQVMTETGNITAITTTPREIGGIVIDGLSDGQSSFADRTSGFFSCLVLCLPEAQHVTIIGFVSVVSGAEPFGALLALAIEDAGSPGAIAVAASIAEENPVG